jgi:hypothetical protein
MIADGTTNSIKFQSLSTKFGTLIELDQMAAVSVVNNRKKESSKTQHLSVFFSRLDNENHFDRFTEVISQKPALLGTNREGFGPELALGAPSPNTYPSTVVNGGIAGPGLNGTGPGLRKISETGLSSGSAVTTIPILGGSNNQFNGGRNGSYGNGNGNGLVAQQTSSNGSSGSNSNGNGGHGLGLIPSNINLGQTSMMASPPPMAEGRPHSRMLSGTAPGRPNNLSHLVTVSENLRGNNN